LILLGVPTISRVYGMTIRMFFKEPGDPQFDARYGGQVDAVGVGSLERIRGREPPQRAARLGSGRRLAGGGKLAWFRGRRRLAYAA
jgi:hypothetical protein